MVAAPLLGRNVREYSEADRIDVASRYVWESFSEEGFPKELCFFPLTADLRYEHAGPRDPVPGTFNILCRGASSCTRGRRC